MAVWADGGGEPWRVGYLERAVAARLMPRLGQRSLGVRFAGWWEEPEGRWHRPVVCVLDPAVPPTRPVRPSLGQLPPARVVHAA